MSVWSRFPKTGLETGEKGRFPATAKTDTLTPSMNPQNPPSPNQESSPLVRSLKQTAIIGILILAACLRLEDLGRESLWGDEINLMQVSSEETLSEVWHAVRRPHSVGYPVFLHYWQKIDRAESMLRLPSALAGVASVWLVYLVGRGIGGWRMGAVAALLLAIAPASIRFSREVAPYGLQSAVIVGVYLVWLRAVRCDRFLVWMGLAVLACVVHYLHPLASTTPIGLYLLAPLIWLLGSGGSRNDGFTVGPRSFSLWKWGISFGAYALSIFPQAFDNYTGSRQYLSSAKETVTFADYFEEILRLYGAFTPETEWTPYFLLPWVVVGTIGLFLRSWSLGLSVLGWALGSFAVWLAFWIAQSHFFDYHYLISHLPAFSLLAAFGICWVASLPEQTPGGWAVWKRAASGGVVLAILSAILIGSLPVLRYEADRKWPNYRDAGAFLSNRLRPVDRYYVQPDHFLSLKLEWYCEPVAEQEVGFDIFFDEVKQAELEKTGGILYLASGKPLGEKQNYERKYFHGATINWNIEAQNSEGFYEKVYQDLLPLDLVKYALILEAQGDLPSALAALVQAASETPDSYRAHRKKGEMLYKLDRPAESIEAFREALRTAPAEERWWIHAEIGKQWAALGDSDKAIESYQAGLKEPEANTAYLWEILGEEAYSAGRFEEAIEAFREAVKIEPDRARSLVRLGEMLAEESPEEARGFLEQGRKRLSRTDYYWHQIIEEAEKKIGGRSAGQ